MRYGKNSLRRRRRFIKRRRVRASKKTYLKRSRYRLRTPQAERKITLNGVPAASDSPGIPIGRINVQSVSPTPVIAAGQYFIGYDRTQDTVSFFPNIARGVAYDQRIGREVVLKSMNLKIRFRQQRNTVAPVIARVIIFRQYNDMIQHATYNPTNLMQPNPFEWPVLMDSTSRFDSDEIKKMQIIHDKKYYIAGDTVPTTFKIGSVSTPGDGDIAENKRQVRYKDVNIYKKLNLKVRYDDEDEQTLPTRRDVSTNFAMLVLCDSGNCGGLPYTLPSPHVMDSNTGLFMAWSVEYTYTDP